MIRRPVLLALQLVITAQSIIDLKYFKEESCTLPFDNVTWYNSENRLLLGNRRISKVTNCQVEVTDSVEEEDIQLLGTVSSDFLLLCVAGVLYHTTSALSHMSILETDNEFYKASSICSSGGILHSVWLPPHLYTVSRVGRQGTISRYTPATGVTLHTSDAAPTRISVIFSHRHFVYTVYTTSTGEGQVARSCHNEEGEHGSFTTLRYGRLSCTAHGVEHRILLAARYDHNTSQLLLLTTRQPAELSGRVICAVTLHHIDNKLDTGHFLDYDEQGSAKKTVGNKIECDRRDTMSYLTKLLDTITSSRLLLSHSTPYTNFNFVTAGGDVLWYFAADKVLDVWKESDEGVLLFLQSVQTNLPANDVLADAGEVTIVGHNDLAFLPLYFCSHIKEPGKCYTGLSCSWSVDDWSCVRATEKRTFAEEYPEGIAKEEKELGGCVTVTTQYTENYTSQSRKVLTCDIPLLPKNTQLLTASTTCLGHLQLTCHSGSDHVSGDLTRQCLPTGNWSGTSPVCSERKCPVLTAAPGTYLSNDDTSVGSMVTLLCRDSCYHPEVTTPIVCLQTGLWNTSLPTCNPAQCYPLPLPMNTILVYSDTRPKCGSKFVVECKQGTDLVYGSKVRTCTKDGQWDGSVPLCTVTHCPPFPTPLSSFKTSTSNRVSSQVTVTCDTCYRIAGSFGFTISHTAQCLSFGAWDTPPPICEKVTCPSLKPNEGVRMISLNTSCIGMAEFECSTGYYHLSGSLVRHCQSDGKWSGGPAKCVPDTCPSPRPGPSVEVVSRGARFGESTVFRCVEGSYQRTGSLELHCLAGGRWSGEVPVCGSDVSEYSEELVTAGSTEKVTSAKNSNRIWVAAAFIGWSLFAASFIFILTISILLRKGRLKGIDIIGVERRPNIDRQITTSTTLDFRKSRNLEPEVPPCPS